MQNTKTAFWRCTASAADVQPIARIRGFHSQAMKIDIGKTVGMRGQKNTVDLRLGKEWKK
ncbi:hypothetical protein AALB16_06545 [Lachnospiraceae bacterium 62-35]